MEQYLTPKIALVWNMKINDFLIFGALILLAVNEAKTENWSSTKCISAYKKLL